ncbi:MAG: hypothetical protein GKR89_26720 [Candidatus Latescibacteria bacterium]|nr:hypothetical protein [Candidatus Latescibacterota bacterium]
MGPVSGLTQVVCPHGTHADLMRSAYFSGNALGPQHYVESPFQVIWSLGLLLLMAFIGQQAARSARLPGIVGWLVAGLILGPSGLQLVDTASSPAWKLLYNLAAVWVGFQVGLTTPSSRQGGRLPLLLGFSTLATFVLAVAGAALVGGLSVWLALLFGALTCLWDPFTVWANPRGSKTPLVLSSVGCGLSLVLLSAVLTLLWSQDHLPVEAIYLLGSIWLPLLGGALSAELLWRIKVFHTFGDTFLAVIWGTFFLAGLVLAHLHWLALPFGWSAGLVLALHKDQVRPVQQALQPTRPIAPMVLFAFLGATIDIGPLLSATAVSGQILLATTVALALVRGLGPAIWYPLTLGDRSWHRRLGWLLMPGGALFFELLFEPVRGLSNLIGPQQLDLFRQVVLGQILVHGLFFPALAVFMWTFPVAILRRTPPEG